MPSSLSYATFTIHNTSPVHAMLFMLAVVQVSADSTGEKPCDQLYWNHNLPAEQIVEEVWYASQSRRCLQAALVKQHYEFKICTKGSREAAGSRLFQVNSGLGQSLCFKLPALRDTNCLQRAGSLQKNTREGMRSLLMSCLISGFSTLSYPSLWFGESKVPS